MNQGQLEWITKHSVPIWSKTFVKMIKSVICCTKIAILFVPFATEEGSPKNIRIGKEIDELPADMTLMKPIF